MRSRHLFGLALGLTLVCLPSVGTGPVFADGDSLELQALALVAPDCSALVLPANATREQALLNSQAKTDFLRVRESLLETGTQVCSATVEPVAVEPTAVSPGLDASLSTATPKTCGDCPNCLSAASCLGCAVGAVCSPPGANPTRACRAVSSCTDFWGNVTYCCGCS